MAEELAPCHPFRGNATVSCDSSSGYMLRGPCMRARQCGKAKGDYPDPQERTASSNRRRECQDYSLGCSNHKPFLGPRDLATWGLGIFHQRGTKLTLITCFPLNLILPHWSQHSGCFHTQQDKGRRLRHDTVPFQAEAGILDSLKNLKKQGKQTTNAATNKKLTATKFVCPFAHARGELGICYSRRALFGGGHAVGLFAIQLRL